jgi:hypothetical protein
MQQILAKSRVLCGLPPLEPHALQVEAAIWASDLDAADVPRDQWAEIVTIARRARPSSSKAFPVTADQVIDCWRKTTAGMNWSDAEEQWQWGGSVLEASEPCRCKGTGSIPVYSGDRLTGYVPCPECNRETE